MNFEIEQKKFANEIEKYQENPEYFLKKDEETGIYYIFIPIFNRMMKRKKAKAYKDKKLSLDLLKYALDVQIRSANLSHKYNIL